MRLFFIQLVCILSCALFPSESFARKYTLLNNDWLFAKGHAADPSKDFNYGKALSFSKIAFIQESTMLEEDEQSRLSIPHTRVFNDSTWTPIDLPHDWGMNTGYSEEQFKVKGYRKLGGRSPENSVGWYRKHFNIETPTAGERLSLEFEGVFRDAQIWVNGIYQGRHESGYTGFAFDITECILPGEDNVITVRVDATHSELWSYEGAGIYRNVWLVKTADIHIPKWGTFVTSEVADQGGKAKITAQTEIENTTSHPVTVQVRSIILGPDGKEVVSGEEEISIAPLSAQTIAPQYPINEAKMWSLENPQRYTLTTQIRQNGRIIDSYDTRFGIRTVRFDPDKGFFLNGKRIQIQGVCCHQDHAGVGIGVPDNLNAWRIGKLKEYGVNAYRASHNPPTRSVLEACDSLGLLVIDEARVLSSSQEGLSQLTSLIRRDRNHPSVILWCMGNEEPAIQGNEMGKRILSRMMQVQRELDPTRLSTAAMNGSWGDGFTEVTDVQGCNYHNIGNIDQIHKDFPRLPILLTEEASTVTTRGEYATVPEKGFHQAYDRDFPGWGDSAEGWMRYVAQRPFVAGAFVWTGFDYGGESTIHYWPGVVSHFGILDYCGFPKDAYWYYKAQWTDEPVLHILPHWNREGLPNDSVEVQIYTNMEEVELLLNGKRIGKQALDRYDIARFNVKYIPGKLEAKGIKNGKKYRMVCETTGKPERLILSSETGLSLDKERRNVAVVSVQVVDKKNQTVPTANSKIRFSVENGIISGVGNGHPSSHERDVFNPGEAIVRDAFHGLAQVILKSDGSGRPVTLTVQSDGLTGSSLKFNILP